MADNCTRCGGLLALESLPGGYEEPITLVKCINCGDRTDPLIAYHRLLNTHHLLQKAS
jgi:hypothetical protein